MASRKRNPNPSLIQILQKAPYDFEYTQAVRILERLEPSATPLGEGFTPSNENIELKSRIFLDWPPSDLYQLQTESPESQRYTLSVNFFGIAGAQGPLPLPYTEKILGRLKKKDRAFEDFLNLFNHRLLSISYRIKKKYRVGVSFTQPDQTKLASVLFSLTGLQSGALRYRLQLPDRALLYYSGLLWQRPRSLKGIETLLRHYFGVPVHITPFTGKWRTMDATQYTRIGFTGQMQVLGDTAALGRKIWDPQGYMDVTLGPLTYDQFQGFLKKEQPYAILCELLTLYGSPTRDFRLRLSLNREEVPQARLGKGLYLGWTSWIGRKITTQPDEQVVLYPHSVSNVLSHNTPEKNLF